MPSRHDKDLIDALCARLAAGETMKSVCRRPGFPAYTTLRTWRAIDTHLSDRISAALATACVIHEQRKPTIYDPDRFATICARLDAGEHLQDILKDPALPNRHILWKWRAQHAHVDEALAARVRRPRGRKRLPPVPPYDEKAAEAFLDRIAKGERVRVLWRDPTSLSPRTWYAWLKTNPELRAGMKGASGHARRKREFKTRKLTPALQAEICRRMYEDGLSLNQIGHQPDMPSLFTLMYWQKDMPAFRDAIALARQMLRMRIEDEVLDIAEAATNATVTVDRLRIGALKKRHASLQAHDPDRQR